MKCPHDATELTTQTYEQTIEVDSCSKCGGLYLDEGELKKIQETEERDYRKQIGQLPDLVGSAHAAALARAKPQVSCPKCSREMERREHGYTSQVFVDVCPHCRGIWLDRGELEALEVFFERIQGEVEPKEGDGRLVARQSFFWKLREIFGGLT